MARKCSFCKCEIARGSGTIYSTKIGDVFNFCGSKCEKNYFMGRNPRKLGWTRKKKKGKK
jgi:large subunit ribosomal protein L24e